MLTQTPPPMKAAAMPTPRPASEAAPDPTPAGTPRPSLVKQVFDFVFALVLLILTAPLILLAALAVKLTSRGPAFYCQTRLGLNGRPYTIYKLRSMTHNCERASGVRWSTASDTRVTWVGRILRRTHIDELPQLWNVLRGEMSLVGPRPERPEFVPQLEKAIPRYRERLQVLPGLTGLAQVQLPPDTDLTSVRLKLAYDLYYVQHRSLWLDFRLLVATAFQVMGLPAGVSRTLLAVPNGEPVELAYEEGITAEALTPQLEAV
jgi:lipopolysaccharide/colanic/teichoic acid biosynthesis glycosyltransferase